MCTRQHATVVAFLLLCSTAASPLNARQFQQILLDAGTEETGLDVLACSDGSFIVTGTTGDFPDPSADVFLLKISQAGSVLWGRTLGGSDHDEGFRVKETADGGFLVAGYTRSGPDPDGDILLVRTDPSGVVLWAKAYGGDLEERCYDMLLTDDGGCLLTGGSDFGGSRGWDAILVKVDENGTIQWAKAYGLPQTNMASCITRTSDKGYLLTGWLYYWGFGAHDMMVIRTDSLGTLESACIIGGWNDDSGTFGAEIAPGKYVIAGETGSFGWSSGNPDILIVGIEDFSHLSWVKVMMDMGNSQIISGCVGEDSSVMLTGMIADPVDENENVVLIKCKPDGALPFIKAYGGSLHDRGRSVSLAQDHGYILTGFANRPSGRDIFLAHTDAFGSVGCNEFSPEFFTYSPAVYGAFVVLDSSAAEFRATSLSLLVSAYGPEVVDWCSATHAEGLPEESQGYHLTQNFPNPFNPRTCIRYNLIRDEIVNITVHDILGRLVTRLVNDQQAAGMHEVFFDAQGLPSGIYFYTLRAGSFVQTKSMTLVR